jgi:hypothetical protein
MKANIPFWKQAWNGWKRIAAKIAHVQGHLILSLIYIVVVAPVAVLFKFFGQDPLKLKRLNGPHRPSLWTPRPPNTSPHEFLKKEY